MIIIGRISWTGFLTSLIPSAGFMIGSLIASVWSLNANFRANFVVAGFSLLTGTASCLWLLLSLACVVTHFEFKNDELTFTRLFRRTRTIPASNVVSVNMRNAHRRSVRFWDGAMVWLRDGKSLFLSLRDLSNAQILANTLIESSRSGKDSLTGCLVRSAVAGIIVAHALTACLLMSLSLFAMLVLGVAFHPNPGVGNRWLFLALGCVLLFLCSLGFYFGILRYWIGCVRWYRLDGRILHYRTVLSLNFVQRLVDELDLVVSRRPTSHQAEEGSWRLLRFRDGEQLKLHIGILHNATALYERLKTLTVGKKIANGRRPAAILGLNHPAWRALQPHLENGEELWWLGRPVYQRLWSEMAAEVIFGLIPGAFGTGMLVLVYQFGLRQGNLDVWPFLIGGVLFSAIGAWMCAAPWRYRKMLKDTVYAVTSRRVLILGGFVWGPQLAVIKVSESIQSFEPDQAIDYEIVGRGRDIVFGGEWRKGRRGNNYWGHHGFLAADEMQAAEAALMCLLSSDEKVP